MMMRWVAPCAAPGRCSSLFRATKGALFPAAALAALACGCSSEPAAETSESTAVAQQAAAGNITGAIQIDGPANGSPGADLFSNVGTPLNVGALKDWVLDSAANGGTDCLDDDGIATCIQPGVTGAAGGLGHWNGVRIVDGIGGGDQNIFLSGGKENDTSTWNVGPGSVGSAKYDVTQAYLSNNLNTLFFGMERSGNNGTTAFDFEFNQKAPQSAGCPQNPLIPCRTVGDVLFTFEMQGSGGNGSATPYLFTWNGSSYAAGVATGIVASINNSTTTAGAPWGHVDSHEDWVLGNLERFSFAEAAAPISLLPGVSACGGRAFVQVRTRSSSTATSDLKDATKIFEFVFENMTAQATLTPSCDGTLGFSVAHTRPDGRPIPTPSCRWTFSDGTILDGPCSGTRTGVAPGTHSASVVVTDPDAPGCNANPDAASVELFAPLAINLARRAEPKVCSDPAMSDAVTYDVTRSGGNGQYTLLWSDASCSGMSCTIDPPDGDFCVERSISVSVSDTSGLCPPANSQQQTYRKVTTITATNN
jgi:hypothetical protein